MFWHGMVRDVFENLHAVASIPTVFPGPFVVQRFLAKRRVDPLMMGGVEGFHKEKEGIRIRSIVAWCISVVVVLPSCISGLQERVDDSSGLEHVKRMVDESLSKE